jgi:hypothetical protein
MSDVKQHNTPCKECPFRRTSIRGWLGDVTAERFARFADWEIVMPCHAVEKGKAINYLAAQTRGSREAQLPQCAGRAIYRANQGKSSRKGLLQLPKNEADVFCSPPEFIEHHGEEGAFARQPHSQRILR